MRLVTRATVVIDATAFIIVALGTVEVLPPHRGRRFLRRGKPSVPRDLAPTLQEIGKLDAVVVIRTFPSFLVGLRDRDGEPLKANTSDLR
jgi:hypothetical protein